MELNNIFKLRASMGGALATNPKSKSEILSETAKTYIEEWAKSEIYGVRKKITSKYLEKGLECEDQAIDRAIEWLDLPFAIKNEKRFEDDFFTGEPDLIVGDTVVDIKNSWDCFTFPLFDTDIPTYGYYVQLNIYMALTGLKKAKLVYVLLDTPATYTTEEIRYDHIDKKYRIKCFDFDYDHELIEKLKTRVIEARKYIKNL